MSWHGGGMPEVDRDLGNAGPSSMQLHSRRHDRQACSLKPSSRLKWTKCPDHLLQDAPAHLRLLPIKDHRCPNCAAVHHLDNVLCSAGSPCGGKSGPLNAEKASILHHCLDCLRF